MTIFRAIPVREFTDRRCCMNLRKLMLRLNAAEQASPGAEPVP